MRIACAQLAAHDLGDAPAALAEALAAVAEAGTAGRRAVRPARGDLPGLRARLGRRGAEVIAAGPDPLAAFAGAARGAKCAVVVGLVLEGRAGSRTRPC